MTTTITTIINSERAKQDDLLTALDGDGEDGVASAARLVHVSRTHRPGGGGDVFMTIIIHIIIRIVCENRYEWC